MNETQRRVLTAMRAEQMQRTANLALKLGLSNQAVGESIKFLLEQGLIISQVHGKRRLYGLPATEQPVPMPRYVSNRPLSMSVEMRAALDRCKELRVYPSKQL